MASVQANPSNPLTILSINYNNICRLCLSSHIPFNNLFNVFKSSAKTQFDKLMVCIPSLNPSETDPLPNNICLQCSQRLDQSYDFYMQCIESDTKLRELLDVKIEVGDETVPESDILKSEDDEDIKTVYLIPNESISKCNESNQSGDAKIPQPRIIKRRRKRGSGPAKVPLRKNRKKRDHGACYDEKGKYIRMERERNEVCYVCDKGFADKFSLEVHVRVHTGERPFICEVCGKSFISRGCIKQHLETHNPVRPKNFECSQCSYQSKYAYRMKRHSVVHKNEYPFSCTICSKSFKLKNHVTIHLRTVHSELSLPCQFCKKIFRTHESLKKHIDRHFRPNNQLTIIDQ